MSMLSMQIAKLRECANNLRRIVANNHNLTKREGEWLFSADTELREAADTIESLRERLHDGRGECEPKWTLQGTTQTQEFWRCDCGNCGYEFGVEDRRSSPWSVVVNSVDVPNYCPECGAKQKAVKR